MILAFLMLVFIVAAVIFFAAQEYVVFTAEGFRFDFPGLYARDTEPPETEPTEADEPVNIEIIDTTAPTAPPETEPTSPPRAIKGLTAARLVSLADFSGGTTSGAPLALYAKSFDGIYNIPPSAQQGDDAQRQTLAALAQNGGPAVFSAMRDAVAPRVERSLAITTTGGVTWLDYDYISWFSPYAGGYMLDDAVRVCAENGISELIFTNLQFPTRGKLEYINFGEGDSPQARVEAVTALLEPLREYLTDEGRGMFMSVVLTENAATHYIDEAAGQDVRELARLCDILYVQTSDPEYDINSLLDVIQGTGCRVGLWLNSATAPERRLDYVLLK